MPASSCASPPKTIANGKSTSGVAHPAGCGVWASTGSGRADRHAVGTVAGVHRGHHVEGVWVEHGQCAGSLVGDVDGVVGGRRVEGVRTEAPQGGTGEDVAGA